MSLQPVGLIEWFARHKVAANLLMVTIAVAGAYSFKYRLDLEAFPDVEMNTVTISVLWRGASPEEVERGIVSRVEEAIYGLEGIKQMRSVAAENLATVIVDVKQTVAPRRVLEDIKNRVDAISTFPVEAERPIIRLREEIREAITVAVAADLPESELRMLGERVRDDLTALPGISRVEMGAARPHEIAIEVSRDALRRYGLTLEQVATAIRRSSQDVPAGTIRTRDNEVLVRAQAQAYTAAQFSAIPVATRPDGTRLILEDVAKVHDAFEENLLQGTYNGLPAIFVNVFRVGDQNLLQITDAVKEYVANVELPEGVVITTWRDFSKIMWDRIRTLRSSAIIGGGLVFVILTLFLRFTLALWVCLGIPVCFLGAFVIMPWLGVSINMISLFAFILVLGIVVDDAIVTGENIYAHKRRGAKGVEAAVQGTLEIALPVTFGVLTTVIAFVPLMLVQGDRAPFWIQIPGVVIPVLLFSLIESKFILPSHLKHLDVASRGNLFTRLQSRVADGLEWFIHHIYQPSLHVVLRWRYAALAVALASLVTTFALVASGRVRQVFFPNIPSENATAQLVMVEGTPSEVTAEAVRKITQAAEFLRDKYTHPESGRSVVLHLASVVGSNRLSGDGAGSPVRGMVEFQVESPERREVDVTMQQLLNEWRTLIGPLPGARSLSFRARFGGEATPVDIQITGETPAILEATANRVKTRLEGFSGLEDISDSFQRGKQELRILLKPNAQALGFTEASVAAQVRGAFFGVEAQRIQRGRDDVRVMVRLPALERGDFDALSDLPVRSPSGIEMPFSEIADVRLGSSYAAIERVNRSRAVNVRADADKQVADLPGTLSEMKVFMDQVVRETEGIRYSFEGEEKERRESFGSLFIGFWLVLFVIYGMLALVFKSYLQPLIVLSVVPFGIIGAVLGHVMIGIDVSIMSMFGLIALVGVVVNDSIVMVDYINRHRDDGLPFEEAIPMAGVMRFRAVLLTSLTTFFGLIPLILEKSTQAQFLIPMAVSLAFGILFSTIVTLGLVPVCYLIGADFRKMGARVKAWLT